MDALMVDTIDLTNTDVKKALFLFEEIALALILNDDTITRLQTFITPVSKTRLSVERIINIPKLHLEVAHFHHKSTDTHIVAFSGVKSMNTIFDGVWRVPCSKKMVSVAQAMDTLGVKLLVDTKGAPMDAKVARTAVNLAKMFMHNPGFEEMLRDVAGRQRVVLSGFSLGGYLTHVFSAVLRLWRRPKGASLLAVAGGAPRTGNAAWARWFNCFSPTEMFAHVNLVFSYRNRVDPVTTIPSNGVGFFNCQPVVFSDGRSLQFDADDTLSRVNFAGRRSWAGMCLASLRFLNGFGQLHRPALAINHQTWRQMQDSHDTLA